MNMDRRIGRYNIEVLRRCSVAGRSRASNGVLESSYQRQHRPAPGRLPPLLGQMSLRHTLPFKLR